MKQGDLKPIMSAYLTDENGTAVDLTDASSVNFIMKNKDTKTTTIDAAAVVADATSGKVTYQWTGSQTAIVGTYDALFKVDWGASSYQSFPVEGYIEVVIEAKLD